MPLGGRRHGDQPPPAQRRRAPGHARGDPGRADRPADRGTGDARGESSPAPAGMAHRPCGGGCRRNPGHHRARRGHVALRARRRSGGGNGPVPVGRHGGAGHRGRGDGRHPVRVRRHRPEPRRLHHRIRRHRLRGARLGRFARRPRRDDPEAGGHRRAAHRGQARKRSRSIARTSTSGRSACSTPRSAARAPLPPPARMESGRWRPRSPSSSPPGRGRRPRWSRGSLAAP